MSLLYQSNILVGTTKVGTIPKDGNGYREVVLGAVNCENSAKAFYPLEPLKDLMLASGDLMRRVKDRALRSEYGHPRRGNMSPVQFLARVLDIQETLTCNHIMRIELDEKRVIDDNGKTIAAVIGWVYPSGPYGSVLEKQFENPEENVAYSIRSITNDSYNSAGQLIKELKQIVTWDYVNEPGIAYAKKRFSPSLESLGEADVSNEYAVFTEETILAAREYSKTMGIATESSLHLFDVLLKESKVTTPFGTYYKKPVSSNWSAK